MKRVFIVHGWDFKPSFAWYPWLRRELERSGFEAHTLEMPNASTPKIDEWTGHLKKEVGNVDNDTYFIGHSIGCQTILRFLEKLSGNQIAGGAVFVSGWINLENLETDGERKIAKPWLETKISLEKAKKHCKRFSAIFSDDDPWVPMSDEKIFKEKLGAETFTEKGKEHFTKMTQLPIALNRLLYFAKNR
ncbi:MAG TPA: alpha/beta hydrolase [Candidatus Nanoarchaeia archaeon]|nr:alpha/beta hydrolase [Candidatus Nanoarchaeia archaeon]